MCRLSKKDRELGWTTLEGRMDIVTGFEWFAEESKSIAEQANEPAEREKFVTLASLWANAAAESTSATSLPPP